MIFTLPYPPSVNNLFLNVAGRGRIITPKYKAWIDLCLWTLAARRLSPVKGRFAITINAVRPDRRKRDLDNLAKPILDVIVKAGLVDDDSLAQRITMAWVEPAFQDQPIYITLSEAEA